MASGIILLTIDKDETIKHWKKKHCKKCKNKDTNLCEIHIDVEGNFKCPYEER